MTTAAEMSRRRDNLADSEPRPTAAEVSDLLRELVAGQHRIIELLERQQRTASVLTRADRAMLEKILPAIAGARGSELFLATELLEDDAPAVLLVCRGLTARQLGRLLRRATNVPVKGLRDSARRRGGGRRRLEVDASS